ncbi:beta-galactosidase trimerization domain-containing protein, partial [PVC group bacterium]|nr:beta-galactosidase trimerization domain-containing protein [PVC group bacterium]
DGRRAYSSQMPALLAPAASRARVWQIPDPLFEELLSTEAPKAPRTCALMWAHPIVRIPMLRDTAKCLATRYVLDEICQELVRHGIVVLGRAAAARERRMASLCYPTMAPRGARWKLKPESIEYALSDAKSRLQRGGKILWGVFAGDELNQAVVREGVELMGNPPASYSFIHEANESLKREFGGGRWGIPVGRHDSNPYRWIAFRRWCNARLRVRQARLRHVVGQHRRDLRVVSFNPQGCLQSLEWSAQAQHFDIFTHQVLPRGRDTSARTGFFTKLLVDLTGKDVWPCVHVEHYKIARTPEETVEILSQVVRNGGTGFHLFLSDISNSNKRVGDTRLCYFGSPRRYHTIMNVIDLARTMPRPVYPANHRTAVLFNDDTIASQPYRSEGEHSRRTEACYLALGPVARSWFTFVDCAQLLVAKNLRERFDTIHLPAARYQRPEIVVALRQFVQHGGTLVCGDASAFQTDTLGNDTASSRSGLFGVQVGDALPARRLAPKIDELGGPLPLKSRALELIPQAPAVKVLATYEDGCAAVTLNSLGEGRAVLFGSNPFHKDAIGDAAWQKFYTRLARWLGAPTGLDIWRFRFPDRVIWSEPQEVGLCLTNNHVVWREELPTFAQNSGLNGSYRYSEPPDALPDGEVAAGSIPFDKGRLTDRRRSILAKKREAAAYSDYELSATHWTESWSTPEPLSVTLDLQRAWDPLCAKLWFCDMLPDLTVDGSTDGETWHSQGRAKGSQAGADVCDLTIALEGAPCRYVRVNFGPRPPRQKMTLVEVEVWGKAPRP